MITKTIQIQEITVDELTNQVADKLLLKIEKYLKELAKKKNDELMTRVEAAKYLKISLTTVHHWTKHGILSSLRMGNRVYYKKQEIIDFLEKYRTGKQPE